MIGPTFKNINGNITIAGNIAAQVVFTNCAAFTKCIVKIDITTIDDAGDLDLGMSIYSLLEYTLNFFDATGSLLFYSKDEATSFNANIAANDDNFYKQNKLIGSTAALNGIIENATTVILLKYLSGFWRSLEMLS